MKLGFPPFSILLWSLALAMVGFALVPHLSLRYLPEGQGSTITVHYQWRGASPLSIEQAVSTPLEGAFSLLSGVKRMYAVASKGRGYISLELDKNADREWLRFEVASKIRQLYPKLPKDVLYPSLSISRPDEDNAKRPVLVYSLSGSATPQAIYQYASEQLAPQLALLDQLDKSEVTGGNTYQWTIAIKHELMQQLGISKTALVSSLQNHFQSMRIGSLQQGEEQWVVRLRNFHPDKHRNHHDWQRTLEQLPLCSKSQQIIPLKKIASITYEAAAANRFYRINALNSIRLAFYPRSDANQIQLAQQIKTKLKDIALPEGYQLHLDEDATLFLVKELDKIYTRTLWSLSILLLFILLVYRSWKYLTLICLSLLVNLGIASIGYYLLEVQLHLYALAAITVSFGIILDNIIVMSHHIRTQGNTNVFPALLAATLTTISALIVVWFLPDQWQNNLIDFGKVLVINLGVSLFVARYVVPALLVYFYKKNTTPLSKNKGKRKPSRLVRFNLKMYKKTLLFSQRFRWLAITGVLLLFGLPVYLLPNKIEGWDWYNKSLGSDYYVEEIKPIVNKVLGGTSRLFYWYVYEGAVFQNPEETILHVNASMPNGATIAQMDAAFRQIERYLSQYKREIKQFSTRVSSGQYGSTQITFEEGFDLHFPYSLKNRLQRFALNLGGVKWNIYGVGKGFSNQGGDRPPSYRLAMYGYNYDELKIYADSMAAKLVSHPRIKSVDTEASVNFWEKDLSELILRPDGRQLALLNSSPFEMRNHIDRFNRQNYTDFYLPNRNPVSIKDSEIEQKDLWKMQRDNFATDSSFYRLLNQHTIQERPVAASIHKEDQQYIRMLEWEYTGSGRFGSKYLEKCQTEMEKSLPLGYKMERRTWNFWSKGKQRQYSLLLLVVGLIFFISTILFESFRQAIAIILLIPASFIGIFMTFYYFDFTFDQGGYVSFLLMSGLVVNSLILLLNDYNAFRKRFPNLPKTDAYLKAFRHKITPILLTIVSTALGLLPFTFLGDKEAFWFSLAIGTIGGLVFSIVVILFFIPLFLGLKK